MPVAHFIQLPKNTIGNDYIIGDVHGCNAGLRAVINDLNEHDRLFIVGDLFDRGPDSIDVYHAILSAIADGKKIHIVRGNHEEMFLDAVSILLKLKLRRQMVLDQQSQRIIYNFIRNGGSWIFSDRQDQIQIDQAITLSDIVPAALFRSRNYCTELEEIKKFINSLPFIILVGDIKDKENSFIVCHADMPFDDNTLQARLLLSQPLLNMKEVISDDNQKTSEYIHVIWARPDRRSAMNACASLPHTGRTSDSLIAYCGHSMLNNAMFFPTHSVRNKTNHVNLDGGAYRFPDAQMFLRMNHATKHIDIISCKNERLLSCEELQHRILLQQAAERIKQHIDPIGYNRYFKLKIDRLSLIDSLKIAIIRNQKRGRDKTSTEVALEMQLLTHSINEHESFLPEELNLSKEQCIIMELNGMIQELQRLITNASTESCWHPGELATNSQSCCWFFSRRTFLNEFYDEVIRLGGCPKTPQILALETNPPTLDL